MKIMCEAPSPNGNKYLCPSWAIWDVRVGQRRSDRTLTCGRHLPRVCATMIAADPGADPLTLTVRRMPKF